MAGGSSSVGAVTPNLPVFPDNLVVFPNRDFVTVEGFERFVDQVGKIEVTRPGVGVIGSAESVISGDEVAFEINHPGGVCWGDGTGVEVTPDIQAGDVVSLSIDGEEIAATTTQDAYASDSVLSLDAENRAVIMTVSGHVADDVEVDELRAAHHRAGFGRHLDRSARCACVAGADRSVRQGWLLLGRRVRQGCKDTFTATYIFDVEAEAAIAAAAGGERAMAWELDDEVGNRQGLTIAEHGEPGGPGMGGCPNGPLQSGPPAPSKTEAVDVTGGIKVNWTPAVAIPGTPAILGYRVTAVAKTAINGEQVEIGRRIMNPSATSTTVTGVTSADYDVNVVSLSDVGETFPVQPVPVKATDTMAPTVSASPVGGSYAVAQQVTLSADEFGADIYYTLDGTNPITAGAAELVRGALHRADHDLGCDDAEVTSPSIPRTMFRASRPRSTPSPTIRWPPRPQSAGQRSASERSR